ncbi:hypothetical protein CFOL_v3_06010 [Cephalotus follicularis]|uniref:Uncharacterized protein n=1 Tax=Cephalotus follicularis TaxID=3775 RepID=A0A1Q3B3B4_CEPFO|nr:hypothetical protein CFOL_v3_06010 [Cephalotus follicularis]
MTNQHKPSYYFIPTLLFFFLLISSLSSLSAARLLKDHFHPQNLAAMEPKLNLALPSKKVTESSVYNNHVSSNCHMETTQKSHMGIRATPNFAAASMIFNLLPKGTVPSSGPSKGTNNLNN